MIVPSLLPKQLAGVALKVKLTTAGWPTVTACAPLAHPLPLTFVDVEASVNAPAGAVTLEAEARTGRFRTDLFYRLDVVHMELPPLRARLEDVPLAKLSRRHRPSV